MSEIDSPPDPNKSEKVKKGDMELNRESFIKILEKADSAKQESLVSENVPDPMDAEQTWPTNEEIEMTENEQKVSQYYAKVINNRMTQSFDSTHKFQKNARFREVKQAEF